MIELLFRLGFALMCGIGAAAAGGGAMIREFYAWLDCRKPCWSAVICVQIACIIASLLIVAYEGLVLGERSAGLLERLVMISAMILTAAFCAGLVEEWMDKRKQGTDT